MIQTESKLLVADNSGAKLVMCIKVLNAATNSTANMGDVIVVSVKSASPLGKVKKGEVYTAVVVRTKKGLKRSDGSTIKFDSNAVVLLNKQREPIGTRVFGPVVRELRAKKFLKIVSSAEEVL